MTWEARLSYWEGSQRLQRSVHAPTQAEAPSDRRQTVGDYVTAWLAGKQKTLWLST